MTAGTTSVPTKQLRSRRTTVLLVAGILVIAANMRPALTSVGPLLDTIKQNDHLSGGAEGLLNTLPLLAFAGIAALAPRIARQIGIERSLFVALFVLLLGTLARALPGTALLFIGTAILGSGIALMNVLLPALIRRDFPHNVAAMTAAYATTMSLVAAVASGVAAPLAHSAPGHWRTALTCWLVLGVIGIAIWIPQLSHASRPALTSHRAATQLWRSPLAWQVTLFMGTQSFGFYVIVTWLPSILKDHGYSTTGAGFQLFLFQIVSLLASGGMPFLMSRQRDQRVAAALSAALTLCGFVGLAAGTAAAPLWVVLGGLGSGAALTLALSFFALRAGSASHVAALSGMAQSIGYLFAAIGPVIFGVLHDATKSWVTPLLVAATIAIFQVCAGTLAGRNRTTSTVADRRLVPQEG
jgi:CP family cyanate transporter-like MFS transporter